MHSTARFSVNPVPPVACHNGREILQMWEVPKWNQDWLDNMASVNKNLILYISEQITTVFCILQ